MVTAILGFGVGLAVNGFEMAMKIATDYAYEWVSGASVPTNDLGACAWHWVSCPWS